MKKMQRAYADQLNDLMPALTTQDVRHLCLFSAIDFLCLLECHTGGYRDRSR